MKNNEWISAAGLPVSEPKPQEFFECIDCNHIFHKDEMDGKYCIQCAAAWDEVIQDDK
jgi:Zn finger protein HypA/HybF involved in hydrogenase expression